MKLQTLSVKWTLNLLLKKKTYKPLKTFSSNKLSVPGEHIYKENHFNAKAFFCIIFFFFFFFFFDISP